MNTIGTSERIPADGETVEIRPRYYRGSPCCSSECPAWRARTTRAGAYKRGGGHCVLQPAGSVLRSSSTCYPAAEADRDELVTLRLRDAARGRYDLRA